MAVLRLRQHRLAKHCNVTLYEMAPEGQRGPKRVGGSPSPEQLGVSGPFGLLRRKKEQDVSQGTPTRVNLSAGF